MALLARIGRIFMYVGVRAFDQRGGAAVASRRPIYAVTTAIAASARHGGGEAPLSVSGVMTFRRWPVCWRDVGWVGNVSRRRAIESSTAHHFLAALRGTRVVPPIPNSQVTRIPNQLKILWGCHLCRVQVARARGRKRF